MKIVAPAATNAWGVLGGVQGRPGGPSGSPEIVEIPIPLFPLVRNADARPFRF